MRIPILFALIGLIAGPAVADETILGGLSWMTHYPATWNAAAPKVVYDGLFTYTALTGFNGNENVWSIARRRGVDTTWEQGAPSFTSNQPPVMYVDRKGRLNLLFNSPTLRHVRFPHPQVDMLEYQEIPTSFAGEVAYLSCSYDPVSDTALLAFNEVPSFTLRFCVKYTDGNDWSAPSALPDAPAGDIWLYAKPILAGGRYAVLAGDHPRTDFNAGYVGAVLFESESPYGPWSARVLHQSVGNNRSIPYLNWCYPLDLQADAAGHLRAAMVIDEDGSGHTPVAEGLYVAREEDAYSLRLVGNHIDDGFPMTVDDSGVSLAFAKLTGDAPQLAGKLVYFKSTDGAKTWSGPNLAAGESVNPALCDRRSGSVPMGKVAGFVCCADAAPPYQTYNWVQVPLGIADTANRHDGWTTGADGQADYVRSYTDPRHGLETWFFVDNVANGQNTLTYLYRERDYYQVYTAKANGSYSYYNSDGYSKSYEAPVSYGYWYTGAGGVQDYVYIFKDPANALDWWYTYVYDRTGAYVYTYVYHRGTYWYVEIRHSNGSFQKSDSTGYQASG